jgi:hypothetical protein
MASLDVSGSLDPVIPGSNPGIPETQPVIPETNPGIPETQPVIPESNPEIEKHLEDIFGSKIAEEIPAHLKSIIVEKCLQVSQPSQEKG